MSRLFPDTPMLSGFWAPWPMEGEIHDLTVVGEIPADLFLLLFPMSRVEVWPEDSSVITEIRRVWHLTCAQKWAKKSSKI